MIRLLLVLALLLPAALARAQGHAPSPAPSEVARYAIEGFIRPGFSAASTRAGALQQGLVGFCGAPSEAALAAVRSQFGDLVSAYGEVMWLRFGPLAAANRYEKLLLWPDPRGIALRQVQAPLAEQDASVTDPAQLQGKSVALRGLAALEFTLFGTGSEALPSGDAFRCAFARSIATVIADELAAIAEEWSSDAAGSISERLINPSSGDVEYREQREVLEELVGAMVHGIEAIRDTQLLPFLGRIRFEPKPRSAMFWRSEKTVAMIASHFEGIERFFAASRLGEVVGPERRWLPMSVSFDFEQVQAALTNVHDPVAAALEDPAQVRALDQLLELTRDLQNLVGVALPEQLGLSVGFSALDGD